MPTYTEKEKTRYLNQARRKVALILQATRQQIHHAEVFACGYAEALADIDAITHEQRADLCELAKQTAEDRVREFEAREADR